MTLDADHTQHPKGIRPQNVRPRNVGKTTAYRSDQLWLAALIHRLSGVGLAIFLPFHFLALGLAIEGEAHLQVFLQWTHAPLVRAAEIILVILLSVHLLGGVRILMIENMPWHADQKTMAVIAIVVAAAIGLLLAITMI